jgi:hypothetical protein
LASCDLGIEMDEQKTQFRVGEVVSGSVTVLTDTEVVCDGLRVALQWFTHGKGNREHGDVHHEQVFTGTWQGGKSMSYPFRFEAPTTPHAYAGELTNIGFRIHATADIPWAIDPNTDTILDVVHDEPPSGLQVSWKLPKVAESGGGCFWISIVLLLIGVGVAVAAALVDPEMGGLSAIFFILGLIGFFSSFRRFLADRHLGPVTIELEQGQSGGYRDGSKPDLLRVALSSRTGAETTGATAKFEMREEVIRGSGTNKKTYTHSIYTSAADLLPSKTGRFEGQIQLPMDAAPYSFYATSNKLVWELKLDIDIPGAAHWTETLRLEAKPTV